MISRGYEWSHKVELEEKSGITLVFRRCKLNEIKGLQSGIIFLSHRFRVIPRAFDHKIG